MEGFKLNIELAVKTCLGKSHNGEILALSVLVGIQVTLARKWSQPKHLSIDIKKIQLLK